METNLEDLQNNSYRYERKFFITNVNRIFVENIILQHSAFFSEIYYERYVNNIYFDYPELNNFMDNIIGNTNRIKFRIRWYGDMLATIESSMFELKIKKGLVGSKKLLPLNKFHMNKGISISELKDVIKYSQIDPQIKSTLQDQMPIMLNRYRRKYFISSDKKFRITIDDDQSFYKISTFSNNFLYKHKDSSNIILELKYDKKYEQQASQITNGLPFRLTKSSKYARGVELLYC